MNERVKIDEIPYGTQEYWQFALPGYTREVWKNKQGDTHRDDGPAVIYRTPDGEYAGEVHFRHGTEHRRGGPSRLIMMNGVAILELWHEHGRPHRDNDLPAVIVRSPNGNVLIEKWCEYGQDHRTSGPARIVRDEITGTPTELVWSDSGLPHRVGGPAWVMCDRETGAVLSQTYFEHGRERTVPAPAPIGPF